MGAVSDWNSVNKPFSYFIGVHNFAYIVHEQPCDVWRVPVFVHFLSKAAAYQH